MGRKIDRIALSAVLAAGLYLFYAAAFRSIPAAIALAFVSMLLLHNALSGLFGRGRAREKLRDRARSALSGWALLDEGGVEKRVRALLDKAYPGEADRAEIAAVVRHPEGAPLTVDALLEAWKGRNCEKLIVAATVPADARAQAYARSLKNPGVRLIDGQQLQELLMKFPPEPSETAQPAPRRRRWGIQISRERAPRKLLFGLMLLAMYVLMGNILYLGASLLSLLFAGLGFRKRPVPKKLFE
ncbi:MAG: hypothetical protein GX592_07685 [Clostridiales bacterium]|nr:hypothetical protein [Clostridiales bacterium]